MEDFYPIIWQFVKPFLFLVIGGAAFCLIVGAAFRRAGARAAWSTCAIAAVLLVTALVLKVERVPRLGVSYILAIYMSSALIGLPLAFATLGVVRSSRRNANITVRRQTAFGFLGFLAGLILGCILAALPDVFGFFSG